MLPRWARFDNVASRIALAVLLTLGLTQALSFALFLTVEPPRFLLFSSRWLTERIDEAATATFSAPPAERAARAASYDDEWLRFDWSITAPPPELDSQRPWPLEPLEPLMRAKLGDRLKALNLRATPFGGPGAGGRPRQETIIPPDYQFSLGVSAPATAPDLPIPGSFVIEVQGADGSWLRVAPVNTDRERGRFLYFGAQLLLIGVLVATFSIWAARKLILPLRTLADAATRVGADPAAAPLPEAGPAELRIIVRAFNDMLGRLRRFVEDRTQMVAAMAHDLRTPLTRLRLRAEFITEPDLKARTLADIAEMNGMVDGVLTFTRLEAHREVRQRIDLATLVASVCADMEDIGAPAEYDGPDHLIVACRPDAMRRALTNLIDNAVKYGARAHVTLRERDGAVEIAVRDNGPGIPPAEYEKVFAPFYRLDPSRNRETGGTGLGLALARTIVRAHGGDITLDAATPSGLIVTVTLPRA